MFVKLNLRKKIEFMKYRWHATDKSIVCKYAAKWNHEHDILTIGMQKLWLENYSLLTEFSRIKDGSEKLEVVLSDCCAPSPRPPDSAKLITPLGWLRKMSYYLKYCRSKQVQENFRKKEGMQKLFSQWHNLVVQYFRYIPN